MERIVFAAINKDDTIRRMSSSGAVFYALAKYTLKQDGLIFGASFDRNWNVRHTHTEKFEDIKQFLGSKYVQSSIGDEYQNVKAYLETGRLVLFSGTPCQITGLQAFLQKDYKNLITVDFICHGVPSPMVWQKYLEEVSKGRKIVNINFREKTEGWLRFSLRIDFSDKSSYRKTLQEDLYLQGFLQNIYLRPSCYECHFKGLDRAADITLADYWGVQHDIPQMFDDRGTSLIFTHSAKGANFWNGIQNQFQTYQIDIDLALSHNAAFYKSAILPAKRSLFFIGNEVNFEELKRMTRKPLKQRVIKKIKLIVRKFIKKRD